MARSRLAAVGALALAAASCGGVSHTVPGGTRRSASFLPVRAPLTIHLSSPAFASGARIPAKYTCAGRNVSPPLRWTAVPAKAGSIALVMIDPDAPGGPFTHWALADIPVKTRELKAGQVLPGTVQGRNGFGNTAYRGPCPPPGTPHHYVIELLALPRPPSVTPGFATGALYHQRPLAAGVLRAVFSRS